MRALAIGTLVLGTLLGGCIGAGEGTASGSVEVPVCGLTGAFDLNPTWFGANREGPQLWVRIQDGSSSPDFTDHLMIQFDDTEEIARRIAASTERDAMGNPVLTLRVGPTGTPGVLAHATLQLVWTCGRTRLTMLGTAVGLWAYDGTITLRSIDRGPSPPDVPGLNTDRLTEATAFDLRLHDPRPVGSPNRANIDPTTPVGTATLQGRFRFYYTRGVPAQPFAP